MAVLLLVLFAGALAGIPALWPGFVRNELFGAVPVWLLGIEPRPPRFDLVPLWLTPLTSALFQGGIVPLVAALLVLELFGPPVERLLGSFATALLLLLSSVVATGIQVLAGPVHTPVLGAAGMLCGLLGAASLLFGRERVRIAFGPFGPGPTVPVIVLAIVAFVLLWQTAGLVRSPDLFTMHGFRACFSAVLAGAASAGLWHGLGSGRRHAIHLGRAGSAGGGLQTTSLRLFPLVCLLAVAWPSLLRLARPSLF